MLYILLTIHIILVVVYTQMFKMLTKKMKNAGALTSILQIIAGLSALVFLPLFPMKISTNWITYLLIGLAIVFYTINDRIHTTTRQNLTVAEYSITQKFSTILAFIWGIVLLKEEFLWSNLIGCIIIIMACILVVYDPKDKKIRINKYTYLQLLAAVCGSLAMTIDNDLSKNFSVPLYYSFTIIVPAILIVIFERIKIKDIKEEFKSNKVWLIILTGVFWSTSQLTILYSYTFGKLTYIAPIVASTVVLNSIVAYFLLKEKQGILLKIIASILVIIAVCIMTFL